MTLQSCLSRNPKGEFKIQEFLELVCGIEEGMKLAALDLAALRPGGAPVTVHAGEFKMPRAT